MMSGRKTGVLPIALATLLALGIGIVGLWAVFTDTGAGDSMLKRLLLTAFIYAVGAAAVGALVPRQWYVSLVAAWGPLALGLLGLLTKLANGGPVPYWQNLALTLLAVPAVAMLFGYLGARARERATPMSTSE